LHYIFTILQGTKFINIKTKKLIMSYSEERHVVIPQGELMDEAKNSLTGIWGTAVTAAIIVVVVSAIGNFVPAISVILAGPLGLGLAIFHLKIAREQEVEIGNVFDGFKWFGKALGTYVLKMVAIILGVILLIIPGIIIAIGLSQTFFIMADDPEIGIIDALKDSWELMDGHKFDYFILWLRFIGWMLLCIFTLGVGFFFLNPYMQVTFAKFYNSIRYGDHRATDGEEDDEIRRHLVD
jgi:uncharacterized membrane protein